MVEQVKIFGLGLSRTGTTSLHAAFVLMGLASVHYPLEASRRWMKGDFDTDSMASFDACCDLPTPLYYEDLDRRYPGAKFILTEREIEPWLNSMEAQWGVETADVANARKRLRRIAEAAGLSRKRHIDGPTGRDFRDLVRIGVYGIAGYIREHLRFAYETHVRNVKSDFADRPEDLLCLDVTRGDGWEKLCSFLGRETPEGCDGFPRLRTPHIGPLSAVRHDEIEEKRGIMRRLVDGDREAIRKDVPEAKGSTTG